MLSRRTIVAIVCSAAFVAISTVYAQFSATQRESQGIKPYTPTRLEWLAVKLNAYCRRDISSINGFMIMFSVADVKALQEEDTILMYVSHLKGVNREVMNLAIESARESFDAEVKSKGWDSWVKLREKVKLFEAE